MNVTNIKATLDVDGLMAAAKIIEEAFSDNSYDPSDLEEYVIKDSNRAKIEFASQTGAARELMQKQKRL